MREPGKLLKSFNEVCCMKKKGKKSKQTRIGTETEGMTWRFGEKDEEGEEESRLSWLCAQRQENKPLKVIQLIHLDNTEASSYRPLPKLRAHTYTRTHTLTHTHTTAFLTATLPLLFLLLHHQQQLLKKGRMKQEGDGGTSGGIKKGEQLRFTPWAMQQPGLTPPPPDYNN